MAAFWRSFGDRRFYLDADDAEVGAWYSATRPRTQDAPNAYSTALWRLGDPALFREAAGKVIRGVNVTLRINGAVRQPADLRVLPGFLAQPLTRALPLQGTSVPPGYASGSGNALTTSFNVTDSTRPIGALPSAADFAEWPGNTPPVGLPGSPEWDGSMLLMPMWAGISTDWVLSAGRVTASGQTDVSTYPTITRFELLVADKPRWTHTFNASGFDVGQQRALALKVAYPDGEPVVGLAITVISNNARVTLRPAGTGTLRTSARAATDAAGVILFDVLAQSVGQDVLSFELDAAQAFQAAYCYEPAFPFDLPISVGGAPPPPDPGQCVTYPEIPAVPGVPARLEVSNDFAWNAGANSVVEVPGDAQLSFEQPHSQGVVLGLVTSRVDVGSYARITHGFYFHFNASGSPVYQVMESGLTKTVEAAHAAASTFTIQRAGGRVSYLVNNAVVYRSQARNTALVMVGCALYASGDRVASGD